MNRSITLGYLIDRRDFSDECLKSFMTCNHQGLTTYSYFTLNLLQYLAVTNVTFVGYDQFQNESEPLSNATLIGALARGFQSVNEEKEDEQYLCLVLWLVSL